MPEYDVAIVGGSVAGCTAAVFFGRMGLRVAVLERAREMQAFKQTCTHYLQASAMATLERLGVRAALEQAGATANPQEMWTPQSGFIASDPAEHGYNVRRRILDPLLRSLAAETPGVTLLLGRRMTGLLEEAGRIVGISTEGGELRARLIVGADGRHGKTGDLAGVAARPSSHGRFFYYGYFRKVEPTRGKLSQIWMGDPDVAYSFPNDDGLTLLGVMQAKAKATAFKEHLEENLRRAFEALPRAPKLARAELDGQLHGMVDMPNHTRPASAPGIAFVGDAAVTSDPISGVGCGWALQSAEWLAEVVGPALKAGAGVDAALARYRRHHAKSILPHHKLIASGSSGRRFNVMERLILRGAGRDPEIARGLMRVNGRTLSPGDFLGPRILLRALWASIVRQTPDTGAQG